MKIESSRRFDTILATFDVQPIFQLFRKAALTPHILKSENHLTYEKKLEVQLTIPVNMLCQDIPIEPL